MRVVKQTKLQEQKTRSPREPSAARDLSKTISPVCAGTPKARECLCAVLKDQRSAQSTACPRHSVLESSNDMQVRRSFCSKFRRQRTTKRQRFRYSQTAPVERNVAHFCGERTVRKINYIRHEAMQKRGFVIGLLVHDPSRVEPSAGMPTVPVALFVFAALFLNIPDLISPSLSYTIPFPR